MKKNEKTRVVLFASIEPAQHEALRYIAFKEKRSIADVTREALARYIKEELAQYPPGELKATTIKAAAAEPSHVAH